jgi:hypothetical protein
MFAFKNDQASANSGHLLVSSADVHQMKNFATPSARDAFARFFSDGEATAGTCIIVPVGRDEAGSYVLGKEIQADNCALAIQTAGDISTREPGVLVVAYSEGNSLVLARYGDTPPDLI